MPTPTTQDRGLRIACDRCYRLKERCVRASPTSSCGRCSRLDQSCLTIRSPRPNGRQRLHRGRSLSQKIPNQSRHIAAGSWLQKAQDLNVDEKQLLIFFLSDDQNLQFPVVSPRYQGAEKDAFSNALLDAWSPLKDAYLAYASRSTPPSLDKNSPLRYLAAAMAALRTLPITSPKDAELCLTLGFTLALSVYGAVGVGVSAICRYCLNATQPFLSPTTINPSTSSRISVLVLLETMDCLVFRRTPTLCLQPHAPHGIDRHLGLCVPLLPYYHDICVISNSLATTTDAAHVALLHQQLEEIQMCIEKWQPLENHDQEAGFPHSFSGVEVLLLLAQARVYRLAALLFIHRLRHRFGSQDSRATTLSREIILELSLTSRIENRSVSFVALPFIVAAVEVCGAAEREEVLRSVDMYVDQLTPIVQKVTKTFLARVWHERDTHPNCSWFESVHKPCVLLDSIDATFAGHSFTI
ncbi:hypothetical protein BU23DRAFT_531300 [Bimuria novae-zelandiae CBS 107.79]|uniref:Zn(2)-C6 fungal-type domain-containing protein n=1 Tax=Bimuria novae-zelandiae CBS 107.79 TaxID=1447943 RepID=A0A6A5VDU0_9PLEO|nr:hypothetical protein BU23DRAFT_531300 [Bimuria novae-zelandiae CBS 107.79]